MPTIREKLTMDFPHANADAWYGPYSSKEEACSKIKYSTSSLLNRRAIGLTIGIYVYNKDGGIEGLKEYWWKSGIKDEDLVEKNTGGGGGEGSVDWNNIQNKPNFKPVATTGSYDDLDNKPDIPSIEGLATKNYVDQNITSVTDSAEHAQSSAQAAQLAAEHADNTLNEINRVIGDLTTEGQQAVAIAKLEVELKEKPSIGDSKPTDTSDFQICDENKNAIIKFENGHFRTKNFDSKIIPNIEELRNVDFSIQDEYGNNIIIFENGHLRTKNFDSTKVNETNVNVIPSSDTDLNIADDKGNIILKLENGDIKTKNFNSKKVIDEIYKPRNLEHSTFISDPTDTYTHAPIVKESKLYRFVIYHSSKETTEESPNYQFSVTLAVINKITMNVNYVILFDKNKPEYINSKLVDTYYNHSCILIDNETLLVRCGCHVNQDWHLVYKTYNAKTNQSSDIECCKLQYNNEEVVFNQRNYINMVNHLCGTTYRWGNMIYTNEITNIAKYNNKYYEISGRFNNTDRLEVKNPHILMESNDAITWLPIKNLFNDIPYFDAETDLAIKDDKIFYTFRNRNSGLYICVLDINGNIIKNPVLLENTSGVGVSSKPSITICSDEIYFIYTNLSDSEKFRNRNKCTIAKINQYTYNIESLFSYQSNNGICYPYIEKTNNGNLLFVYCEDKRNFKSHEENPITNIGMLEIELYK